MTSAIVIGGGIAGCSTAYFLAKRGLHVTLIEREYTLAQGASGNPTAMLYPKLSATPTPAYLLGVEGFLFSLDLLKKLDKTTQFHARCGQIQLAHNAKTQAQHEKIATCDNFSAMNLAFLNAPQASEHAGFALPHGGLYLPDGAWVNPQAWCAALTQHPYIQVLTTTKALKLATSNNGWRVDCAETSSEAEHVILCNAHDACDFLPHLKTNVRQVRGQINFFEATAASQGLKTIVCGEHFVSPSIDGMHSFGASYSHSESPQLSLNDTRSNLNGMRDIAPALAQHLQAEQLQGRVAWRCATQDYMPLSGQLLDIAALQKAPPRPSAKTSALPWLHGLYINIGHGSKGMLTAPLCGSLLADAVCENISQNPLFSAMQPNRFAMRELGLKSLAQRIYR